MTTKVTTALLLLILATTMAPAHARAVRHIHHRAVHQYHAVYLANPTAADTTLERWIMQTWPSGPGTPSAYGNNFYSPFAPSWYYPPGFYGSFGGPGYY